MHWDDFSLSSALWWGGRETPMHHHWMKDCRGTSGISAERIGMDMRMEGQQTEEEVRLWCVSFWRSFLVLKFYCLYQRCWTRLLSHELLLAALGSELAWTVHQLKPRADTSTRELLVAADVPLDAESFQAIRLPPVLRKRPSRGDSMGCLKDACVKMCLQTCKCVSKTQPFQHRNILMRCFLCRTIGCTFSSGWFG